VHTAMSTNFCDARRAIAAGFEFAAQAKSTPTRPTPQPPVRAATLAGDKQSSSSDGNPRRTASNPASYATSGESDRMTLKIVQPE